ncbi:hypothetical protein ABRH25_000861 [Salmonella enterica subsp. enterica]
MMNEDPDIHLTCMRESYEERQFFFEQGLGAEIHWFFVQGAEAIRADLYLPACTSLINGVELSIRLIMAQMENSSRVRELNPKEILSNKLLANAHKKGLPVNFLAFPGEDNFIEKITSTAKHTPYAEIVRIRHNICHGNILEYVNTELGESHAFFTPECCRSLSITLLNLSKGWTTKLGEFRRSLNTTGETSQTE